MLKINKFYKCKSCIGTVSVVEGGDNNLECCGQKMVMLVEQTTKDEGKEKHVPVINVNENKVSVKVGSTEHPMEENHYIQLIQILQDGNVIGEKRLHPNQKPEAVFCVENTNNISARALCNIHGLWAS